VAEQGTCLYIDLESSKAFSAGELLWFVEGFCKELNLHIVSGPFVAETTKELTVCVILAESHITVKRIAGRYYAIDIFTCTPIDSAVACVLVRTFFRPIWMQVHALIRKFNPCGEVNA